jgi:glycosyltransferase involved in cell wall biosynthesis
MKILLINKYLYPKGGADISMLNTGKLLSARGHEVFYWGMKHPQNVFHENEKYLLNCIDYDKKHSLKESLKQSINILYSFEAKSKIMQLISKEKPDIIHLNNIAQQISPSILDVFSKFKIPCVMTLHDYKLVCPVYLLYVNGKTCEKCRQKKYINCFLNKCTKSSYMKSLVSTAEMYLHHSILHIYKKIDTFISTSKFLKNKLNEMGFKDDIVCLPDSINPEEYNPHYGFSEKAVCYIGRLSREKGLLTLINAMAGLNFELKIIGDGPMRKMLEDRVKDLKLQNIRFLGYKSGNELNDEIAMSIAVVIPSEWYENNPRSVLEAFALGKPVIGARIGGIPELVMDNFNGFTFEPGNHQDLREKMLYLIRNSSKISEMGKNGRRFVEENFNPSLYYDKLIEIYNSVLNK